MNERGRTERNRGREREKGGNMEGERRKRRWVVKVKGRVRNSSE